MHKFQNIYQQAYLQILKQASSTTDYTPNDFVQKIYQDLKSHDFKKDFILQYNINDFKKYVNKNNFKYYNQFIKKFKGTNDDDFAIVILNYAIFDKNKLNKYVSDHISHWNDIKTKVKTFQINEKTDKALIQQKLSKKIL